MALPSAPEPLPAWAVASNEELMLYLRSLTFKAFPADFLIQIKFYLAFKCVLILVGVVLVAKLMLTGRWWLFRVVQVPNGKIICPNACEALFLSACIFYLIDLVYRGYSIHWCSDIFSVQSQSMLAYCIRIYFLWLAGFIHTASTMLIWPLDPARLRPAYWHAFLFGVPIVHFIVFIVPSILFDVEGNKVNEGIVDMLRQLSALPAHDAVSEQAQVQAAALRQELAHAWRWATVMAAVLFGFLVLITISSIASGYTIISRTAKRYRQLKNEANEAIVRNMSDISHSKSIASSLSRASSLTAQDGRDSHYYDTRPSDINWRRVGIRRLLLYVLGAKPLRQIGRAGSPTLSDASPAHSIKAVATPSRKAVLAILKDFLIFSVIHHGAVVGIMLTMSACVLIFLANSHRDLFSAVHDPTFVTSFGRTTYVFLILEVYAIILLGTPLVICVLWRQIYPICVDMDNDVYTRKQRPAFVRSDGSPRKSDVDLLPDESGRAARWVPTTRLSMTSRQHGGSGMLDDAVHRYNGAIVMKSTREAQPLQTLFSPTADQPSEQEVSIAMEKFVNANVQRVAKTHKLQQAFVQRSNVVEITESTDGLPMITNKLDGSPQSSSTATWESPARPSRINRDFCGVTGVHPGVRQIVLDAIEAGASNNSTASSPSRSSPPRSTLLERRTMAQHRQREHQRSVDLQLMRPAEQNA